MSTELKYSLTLLPTTPAPFNTVGLWCVLALVAMVFSPTLISGLLVSITLGLILLAMPPLPTGEKQTVIVTEDGQWQQFEGATDFRQTFWQVDKSSLLLPFALYIVLSDRNTSARTHRWVFRSQIDDVGYRRLSRIVFRQGLV